MASSPSPTVWESYCALLICKSKMIPSMEAYATDNIGCDDNHVATYRKGWRTRICLVYVLLAIVERHGV